MTEIEYDICDTQAMIYSYAAKQGYDMRNFSDLYMSSDFCAREMDAEYSVMQLADDTVCWEYFEPEIGTYLKKSPDGRWFDADVAWWIGFTYRQLAFVTGKSSAEIAQTVNYSRLKSRACKPKRVWEAGKRLYSGQLSRDIWNRQVLQHLTIGG